MKKGCIITFNQALNYGAVLQMYALQNAIGNNLGVQCDVVDYRSGFFSNLYREKNWKDYLNPRFWLKLLKDNSPKKYNVEGFQQFCTIHIRFTEESYSRQNISSLNSIYNVFISGSDQVFNPLCSGMDPTFFQDFVDENGTRGSYAASLGFAEIPDSCKDYLEMLSGFAHLSIRESTSAAILREFLHTDKAQVNIDPTLLLDRKAWASISDPSRRVDCKYVLVYAINEDKDMLKHARSVADELGCEAVYLTDRYIKPRGFRCVSGVTPEQWLDYFMNAEYIVTNSFHGVAFSINFKKRFCPYMLINNAMVNTRVVDLLKTVRLEYLLDRPSVEKTQIDYDSVHEILKEERAKAIAYLSEMLLD